jgi:hypothetical protein
MENIKKKMEGHSSRIEQTEDRISELQDEMVVKEKIETPLINGLLGKKNFTLSFVLQFIYI